jgi:hypothetical protein
MKKLKKLHNKYQFQIMNAFLIFIFVISVGSLSLNYYLLLKTAGLESKVETYQEMNIEYWHIIRKLQDDDGMEIGEDEFENDDILM